MRDNSRPFDIHQDLCLAWRDIAVVPVALRVRLTIGVVLAIPANPARRGRPHTSALVRLCQVSQNIRNRNLWQPYRK